MTQETNKDIIVYTIIDDKYKIIGEFESIDLAFRFPPQDEIPTTLPEETQIAFILNNGSLLLSTNDLTVKTPRFNIIFNNFSDVNNNISKDCKKEDGRWEIYRCRLDTIHHNQYEGLAEAIRFIPETLEEFKQKLTN